MQNQPQEHHHFFSFGIVAIWAVVAGIGASFSAMRQEVSIRIAALHVAMASFIGACTPYAVLALWREAPWYVGIPIAMVIGLLIFGIAVMIDRTEKRVGKIDPTNALPEKFRPPSEQSGGN